MTIIAYYQGILAADTRSTNRSRTAVCRHCEKETPFVAHTSNKIVTDIKGTFRGEKVIAAAGAGRTIAVSHAIKLINNGINIEEAYRMSKLVQLRPIEPEQSFSLLIVTEKNQYAFMFGKEGVEVHGTTESGFMCIGSGTDFAVTAHRLLKANAVDSVKLAVALDGGCGGDIHSIDCSKPEVLTVYMNQKDSEGLLDELREKYPFGPKPKTSRKTAKQGTQS